MKIKDLPVPEEIFQVLGTSKENFHFLKNLECYEERNSRDFSRGFMVDRMQRDMMSMLLDLTFSRLYD